MNDPTIPRKARPSGNAGQGMIANGPTQGRFIDYGNKLMLQDSRNNSWSQDSVRMLCGSFGYDEEGMQRAPRPWKFAPGSSTPLVVGDWFLIEFLDGDPRKPIVLGGVSTLNPTDPAFFHNQPIGKDPNPIRLRAGNVDPNGVRTGTLQITALDGGNSIEIVVGGPSFGTGTRIVIDFDAAQIKLGMGNETQPVPLGLEIAKALNGLAADVLMLNTGIAPPFAPAALKAAQILIESGASQTAFAPYLSRIVKVE